MVTENVKLNPKEIFDEYKAGNDYKSSIGDKGIFEQSKINERFYVGDQWYGAQTGNERPLIRKNVIKRIGDYKVAVIGSAPLSVNFSADGIPDNTSLEEEKKNINQALVGGQDPFMATAEPSPAEISVIMSAMSDYFAISSERMGFNILCQRALTKAFTGASAFMYTYWDDNIMTGLYVDEGKTTPIKGDTSCEVLSVENVNLGDPNCDNIQNQPYIIVSQRKIVSDVKREAETYEQKIDDIVADKAESYNVNGGDRGEKEPENSKRVTVLTKFWKEYDEGGRNFKIYAIKVTEKAVVRPKWDLGITMYPIAKFTWQDRDSCAYGDTEVTYLIPNQIAINRAMTASVWATMIAGAPKVAINTDAYDGPFTNDPAQVIRLNNLGERTIDQVIKYLQPPPFAGQFDSFVQNLASGTLTDSGATDAALGNVRPDNALAIIQSREASLQPIQILQNKYYAFVEECARIRADFWVNLYGDRHLKVVDRNGTRYVPFYSKRYKNLVINAKVDVGASTLYSESVVISSLDALLTGGYINFSQYLERLPKGLIPDVTGLIEDQKVQQQGVNDQNGMMKQFAEQYPQEYAQFVQMPPEQQQEMLQQIMGGGEEAMI
jgi:hypothetical protein